MNTVPDGILSESLLFKFLLLKCIKCKYRPHNLKSSPDFLPTIIWKSLRILKI